MLLRTVNTSPYSHTRGLPQATFLLASFPTPRPDAAGTGPPQPPTWRLAREGSFPAAPAPHAGYLGYRSPPPPPHPAPGACRGAAGCGWRSAHFTRSGVEVSGWRGSCSSFTFYPQLLPVGKVCFPWHTVQISMGVFLRILMRRWNTHNLSQREFKGRKKLIWKQQVVTDFSIKEIAGMLSLKWRHALL